MKGVTPLVTKLGIGVTALVCLKFCSRLMEKGDDGV
jgi:hypothetical protein